MPEAQANFSAAIKTGLTALLRKGRELLLEPVTYGGRPAGKPRPSTWRLMLRLGGYFRPYGWHILWASLAMLVVALATGGSAYLIKPALDDIFFHQNRMALFLVPALFILLTILKGLGRFFQNYLMSACGLYVLEQLRFELYARIISLPMRYFEDNQVGMLMSRIITDVLMMRQSLPSLIQLVRQVLTMVALLAVVFYQDAYLAFLSIVVLPLAVYPVTFFSRRLRALSRGNQARMADISTFLQENFSGVRVIKAFASEKRAAAHFRSEHEALVGLTLKESALNEVSSPFMELVGALGMALVIWYGGSRVVSGESTPGTFFSFLAGIVLLYDPIKRLNDSNRDIQMALAGAERVFEILDSPDLAPEQGGDVPFSPPFAGLVFEDVGFTYGEHGKPALQGINLTVRPGQRVAIVGPSGAGKTTLASLIPAFHRPTSGRILLNGRDLRDYDLASLRRHMGQVSQEAFLFNMSIRDNIAYAEPLAGDERVRAAATAAYAHEFVENLPEGYDTMVGERGTKLSGGQRQRLTIARALFANPPVLILDEATSALDSESERIVQLALGNLMQGRTSIVIAHRLSTILTADLIVVMDRGRIVCQGRHAELLENCPLYANLYRMQFDDQGARDAAGPKPETTDVR